MKCMFMQWVCVTGAVYVALPARFFIRQNVCRALVWMMVYGFHQFYKYHISSHAVILQAQGKVQFDNSVWIEMIL